MWGVCPAGGCSRLTSSCSYSEPEVQRTQRAAAATNLEGGNRMNKTSGAGAGAIWFAGWLFTISFAHLAWWKVILGVVVWPLFLGQELG